MNIILFDLGNVLERDNKLVPGALETLRSLKEIRGNGNQPLELALISDYPPANSPEQINILKAEYYNLLSTLGLRSFFEPLEQRVTLSTEVGINKPAEEIFRTAIDKIHKGLPFHHVFFITENYEHIVAARNLGMTGIHFKAPGQQEADIDKLVDLIPLIDRLVTFSPCGKKRSESPLRTFKKQDQVREIEPNIENIVSLIDKVLLHTTISDLISLGPRYSYSQNIVNIPSWIHDRFIKIGYQDKTEVFYQKFDMPNSPNHRNVLCRKNNDKPIILICCHYDSISEIPSVSSPGADDDASGVAAIFEIARVLMNIGLRYDIMFAAFGGEEQGLYGSDSCAEIAKTENWKIELVINLDMISYHSSSMPYKVVVEYDQGNAVSSNDNKSKEFGIIMAKAADYTSLQVEHTDIWNSDYISFEKRGFVCIGAYNAEDNPFYHKSTDTIDKINIDYLAEVVKMVLATILKIAG